MAIPTRAECLEMMDRAGVPEHIRRHCEAVATVAIRLAQALSAQGIVLDLALVESAALLHDIGKARALETRAADHGKIGADMLVELGCAEVEKLAPAVREHTMLAFFEEGDALTESLVVNYADKRVMHDAVVSLDERFADLAARYANSDMARAFLATLLERYRRLEAEIFEKLPFGPDGVT